MIFEDLLLKCKTATLYSQSSLASQLLRTYNIDKHQTSVVADKAKNEFYIAEDFFKLKDYPNTKLHYQLALRISPDYYKATIYLGDTYWHLNKLDSAIYYFKKGIELQPASIEPHIYLLEALIALKKNDEVKNEFENALAVYPDIMLFNKMVNFYKQQGVSVNKHWIKRACPVNVMGIAAEQTTNTTWLVYQSAKEDMHYFCDSDGIIQDANPLTTSKYLEVYSWEKMLNNVNPLPKEFGFAKKMYDAGYLDCFVFISDFHFDCYEQYKDFVLNNKGKIKKYVETYLIEK